MSVRRSCSLVKYTGACRGLLTITLNASCQRKERRRQKKYKNKILGNIQFAKMIKRDTREHMIEI